MSISNVAIKHRKREEEEDEEMNDVIKYRWLEKRWGNRW